jgi:hypothetical protein
LPFIWFLTQGEVCVRGVFKIKETTMNGLLIIAFLKFQCKISFDCMDMFYNFCFQDFSVRKSAR